MLLGDVLLTLWSSFKQLKAWRVRIAELPLTSLFLALEILDEVHGYRPTTAFSKRVLTPFFSA